MTVGELLRRFADALPPEVRPVLPEGNAALTLLSMPRMCADPMLLGCVVHCELGQNRMRLSTVLSK